MTFDRWYLPEELCAEAASRYPPLGDLLSPTILHDLHSLLWTAPKPGDHGWNCRDHALVVAGFLGVNGKNITLCHGRCMFVQGSAGDFPSVGLGEELSDRDRRRGLPSDDHPANWGHTWLIVPGVGHLDVSARLDVREGGWRPLKHVGVIGEEWWVEGGGDFVMSASLNDYGRAYADASWLRDSARAVYVVEHEQSLPTSILKDPFAWAYSPLSETLKKAGRPPRAYLKLIDHLVGLSEGSSRPLAGVSWNRAWEIVDARSEKIAREIEAALDAVLRTTPSSKRDP